MSNMIVVLSAGAMIIILMGAVVTVVRRQRHVFEAALVLMLSARTEQARIDTIRTLVTRFTRRRWSLW
jgi:hypothetical protein